MAGTYKDERGLSVVGAAAPIPELNWIVLAEMDEREVLAPVKRQVWVALYLWIAIALPAIALAAWLVSRLIRPVAALHQAASRIAAGRWDARVPAGQPDELGALGLTFNEMAEAISAALTRERKLSSALQQTADAVVITDRSGRIEYVNPAFEETTGYTEREALGQTPRLLKSGEHDDAFYRRLWSTILAGDHFRAVFVNRRKNGEIYYEDKTITPVKNGLGTVTHFVSAGRDITERIKAAEERERLIAIIEATPDLVVTCDERGRVHYINRAGRQMLGIADDEAIENLNMKDHCAGWAWERIESEAIPTAIAEGIWRGETALLGRDGREIPVSQVIQVHRGRDGRVQFFATIAQDIRERKQFEARLAFLANHDPLTGLFNRRRFQEELESRMAEAKRHGHSGALMFPDLDRFKDVNDTFGHQAGDELLRRVATALRQRLRETDVLARLGGDEFAILLPHTNATRASQVAHAALEAVVAQTGETGGQATGITVSVGVALFPEHADTSEALLVRADKAMYKAKALGGNCVSL